MAEETKIAWTDHTFNFWMGCTKVSEGCRHCYAETLTNNRMGLRVWGPGAPRKAVQGVWANIRKVNRENLAGRKRTRGFVMSLGDFFEDRPDVAEIRIAAWEIIKAANSIDFQVLTKRPQNIAGMLPHDWGNGYPNVWLGTTIEDNRVIARADHLRKIPAVVRFVSYEPAIGPLDKLDLAGIDWLIFGGESGPGFRPMDVQWARDIRDRCQTAGTVFFFKQSAGIRTGMGETLDGEIVRKYPVGS
jgi:protein gp37